MDPEAKCQKELDEFLIATEEWVRASERKSSFISFKPINDSSEIPVILDDTLGSFRKACNEEDIARKIYYEKFEAYYNCIKKR